MNLPPWTAMFALVTVASCAGSGPYRFARSDLVSDSFENRCQALYAETDRRIKTISTDFQVTNEQRDAFLTKMQDDILHKTQPDLISCWRTAHEKHSMYDLYYAEFDDAGQATDRATGSHYDESQLHLIEDNIRAQAKRHEALNIVVFTHGWHGNARADSSYSIEFKAILQDIVAAETNYRQRPGESEKAPDSQQIPRRVVGIEIAWRGDSLLTPALPFYPESENALSVWDRKLAAETISTGSVQELLAFLNEVYLENSCHGTRPSREMSGASCDRVHLLSIGHSFGALINYRALVSRLESGLNVKPCYRVFGFGDMTILLNPAFEGARYRGLFNNAISREEPYFGAEPPPEDCRKTTTLPNETFPARSKEVQVPSIVILQSLADTATGTFFPTFRRLTTPFAQTLSPEEVTEKNDAVGWVPDFRTHSLTLRAATLGASDDQCQSAGISFCPFPPEVQADLNTNLVETARQGLLLSWQPGTLGLPAYMPLWSVAVDPAIMKDHDDIWNPQIVRLISVLFADSYQQTERMHGRGQPF